MASLLSNRIKEIAFSKISNRLYLQQVNNFPTARSFATEQNLFNRFSRLSRGQKWLLTSLGLIGLSGGALIYALEQACVGSELQVHPTPLPWSHKGPISSFDHASLRRGYEVYKTLCASCHSLQYVAYRDLVGVTHTVEEAKAEAAAVMIKDGPNDMGEYFERPGKLGDYFPSPYPNEEAARYANNGANPPDLSYIVFARHGGEDYIFSLLTGYCDPPAGVKINEGQYYNPYFPGGAISMPRMIFNESVEFGDGTPAYASQIAKDVSAFLVWASDPHHDTRKKMGIKMFTYLAVITAVVAYHYRFVMKTVKSQKLVFNPKRK